ncbi:PREDICTED: choline transporter-like protein 2 [Acropora digitifera]|uniref:choline transporter-like protein 2 n=1 Tax=Acropora digitifera TaxID=70779 RepID=UPI00077AF022|nr:PREDICTED: choline transporter-like protein 2 [Acropora digitifera]
MASQTNDNKVGDNTEVENLSLLQKGGKRKYDPKFRGPIADRSCTDIICCLLFVAYIVGMIIVGIIAFKEGDPDRLLSPTDSNGNTCGKGDYKVCVSSCPKENQLGTSPEPSDMVCKEGVGEVTKDNKFEFVRQGKCAPYYLASSAVLYRCIPTLVGTLLANGTAVQNRDGQNVTKGAVEGGIKNFSLDRWITGLLVWLSILLVFALLIAGMYCCYSKYKFLQDSGTSQDFQLKFTFDLDVYKNSKETWLVLGIFLAILFVILFLIVLVLRKRIVLAVKVIKEASKAVGEIKTSLFFPIVTWLLQLLLFAWFLAVAVYPELQAFMIRIFLAVLFVILFLIVLVLRKRIVLAVKVIKEASKAVGEIKTSLFFPIVTWLLQLLLFAWFLAVAVYLVTNGTPVFKVIDALKVDPYNLTNGTDCNPKTFENQFPNTSASCVMAGLKENVHLLRMQIFHLFGWFWIMNFIIALGQCVLAGAFASWYFTYQKPDDIPALPIISSFWRTLRYHTGSLAFGAAIIAIVQLIRAILEYIDAKLKEYGQDNKVIKFILCCCKCCFWCLEKILKFLNKNAYIVVRYCHLLCVNLFMHIWLLLGVASFFWFGQLNKDDPTTLQFSVVPTILMVIFAYAVSVLFFDVYDMAIDTVFLCVMIDLDMNDGSAEKPYFMSDSLKKMLDVENRSHPDGTEKEAK